MICGSFPAMRSNLLCRTPKQKDFTAIGAKSLLQTDLKSKQFIILMLYLSIMRFSVSKYRNKTADLYLIKFAYNY